MPNLKRLNYLINELDYSVDSLHMEVPNTLENLHLQVGEYHTWASTVNLYLTNKFLTIFKSHVRSLTLIIINGDKGFSNYAQFQHLANDFAFLETFQYDINTIHQPNFPPNFSNVEKLPGPIYSIYTLPKPQHLDTPSERPTAYYHLSKHLSLKQLFVSQQLNICNSEVPIEIKLINELKLVNLHIIQFDHSIETYSSNVQQFLSKLISLAPNINKLKYFKTDSSTKKLIEYLYELFPLIEQKSKQIISFEMFIKSNEEENYHSTLIYQLSQIFPNLKTLTIIAPQKFFHYYSKPSFIGFIQELRTYFRKLSNFIIQMQLNHSNDYDAYENYKKDLNEALEKNNSFYYTFGQSNQFYSNYINIWL